MILTIITICILCIIVFIINVTINRDIEITREEIKRQEERNKEIDRRFAYCLEHSRPFRNRKYIK